MTPVRVKHVYVSKGRYICREGLVLDKQVYICNERLVLDKQVYVGTECK